jgi:hypothetical protein
MLQERKVEGFNKFLRNMLQERRGECFNNIPRNMLQERRGKCFNNFPRNMLQERRGECFNNFPRNMLQERRGECFNNFLRNMLQERRGEGLLNIQKIRRHFECSFLFIQSSSSCLSRLITFFSHFSFLTSSYPVTVAERSKACTVFARSEAGIVVSNPTYDMDVRYVYVFILCLCCPVFK